MSGASKGKKNRWYGYLEAGASSSPVMRDDGLDTGNPKTVFLFNLGRGRILEYSREIVESKLRELEDKESKVIAQLDAGYAKARRNFKDRNTRVLNIPERGGVKRPVAREADEMEFAGFGLDDNSDDSWLDAQVD
jgi:hypothetical protein